MIYSNSNIETYSGTQLKQVNIKTAEKKFNAGEKVHICASNLKPSLMCCEVTKKSEDLNEFENLVNHFSYYNCGNIAGKRVLFFIKKEV